MYTIIYKGISYDLPNYSIKISEKLEEIELLNRGNQKFRDKCKKMYDFISEMIGKENCIEIIGKFEDSDPNTINIVYLEIVKSYNTPLEEYRKSQMEDKLDSSQVEKILEVVKAIPAIKEMEKQK